MKLLRFIWNSSKRWRTVPLGPVSISYRVGRTAHVSSNTRRRLARVIQEGLRRPLSYAPQIDLPMTFAQLSPDNRQASDRPESALIVGVGPGLGYALARRCASAGMHVALVARNAERLDPLAHVLSPGAHQSIRAYGCDATDECSVKSLMSHMARDMGVPHLVIYSVQGWHPGRAIDVDVYAFEECWRQNCLGAFIVAREAARSMAPLKRGTIVLIGSTSSIIGRADHVNLAVGKFGLRALSQVMARELWPDGIHVVHVIIDANIEEDEALAVDSPQARPEDIADMIYVLHRQAPSAWTSEIDVRPWNERFWEHC